MRKIFRLLLYPARNNFLSLVYGNVFHLKDKLNRANERDSVKVKTQWEKLGGNYSELLEALKS